MKKFGDCIRCGYCCIKDPCGLAKKSPCEHLSEVEGVNSCAHYPFDHLGEFERICLSAGSGCGYAGQNTMYLKLWKSLTK